MVGEVNVGDVVSLNDKGMIQKGEGTTITKNKLLWKGKSMSHVYSTNVGSNILVIAYDGYVSVNYISDDGDVTEGETVPLPSIEGYPLSVDDLITLDNKVVVLIGSTNLLPISVSWDEASNSGKIVLGDLVRFTEPASYQPVIDTLGERCFAIGYFYSTGHGIKMSTRTGCVDAPSLKITLNDEVIYSDDYTFHGIAGLSETKYVLAKSGSLDGKDKDIHFQLATVNGTSVIVDKEVTLQNRSSFGFFDMDK